MNVENLAKRMREKAIMENMRRGKSTKAWKETVKNDMKRRNVILEMLKKSEVEMSVQTGEP